LDDYSDTDEEEDDDAEEEETSEFNSDESRLETDFRFFNTNVAEEQPFGIPALDQRT
jgi:hypothetical protein